MIDRSRANEINGSYVKRTIDSYLDNIEKNNPKGLYKVEVSFFGGTFTGIDKNLRRELLEVAGSYKNSGRIHHIRCSTRPDYIDEEVLEEVKSYGMDKIELGIQSLDDEVLLKSARGHTKEDAKRASKLIKDYGIILGHQIMPGLPLDDFEKDIRTVKESIKMGPQMVRIYPTLVIKDTALEEMYREGSYKPYSLEEAVDICGKLLSLYELKGIKVIRCGLQPTEELNVGGSIVAGPFHPAFLELVKGKRLVRSIEKYLNFLYPDFKGDIWVAVNPKDLSLLYAGGKRYYKKIQDKLCGVETDLKIERGMLEIRRGSNLPSIEVCI